jgi:hypothetical protein
MELLSGHEKIITKSGISLNAGTLNRGFTYNLTFNLGSNKSYLYSMKTFNFRVKNDSMNQSPSPLPLSKTNCLLYRQTKLPFI